MSTPNQSITAGGLRFQAEYRYFGDDRGPAVRVFADVGGKDVQVLRFDCFVKDPHYHYDPTGRNEMHHLDRGEVPDPLAWSLDKIRTEIIEMLRHGGFEAVAARVDAQAVVAAMPQIEEALKRVSPAQVGLTGIHHNSVIISKPDEARAFYGGILGLEEVPYPSTFPNPVIWYKLGDQQIHLMIHEQPDTRSGRHVALQVEDAAQARSELAARGIEIRETVRIPGADRFYISDPDGNLIELIEWKVPWGQGET